MSEPRWLTDEEQRVWRDFYTAVGMLRAHLETQLQQDANMPHTYYELLVTLSEAPGQVMRMSDLAVATRSSRSRLSHAIARMEDNGWVRRRACETDKRGSFAHLTQAGLAALEAAAPGHVEAVRASVFDQLSPEQVRQLGDISAVIVDNLSPRCAAAAEELERLERDPAGA
ncbi:MarR family winged helix-turn-helix transcriptional regulator [Prauserella cavernicola]|uniref:MarR family transcriptional regulator n=1 Tax=Prauserella cavernicola TaxID=2800127 RepID=A0A934V8R6_9PSEU|nr:MarR family transcriptional regulator [Prauserella cavernicola]MBK1788068.1 MarR family transcriptional regulator [Prauserella cavernicola]